MRRANPRDYLSWSQYSTYKKSPASYFKIYVLGEELQSDALSFGKRIAEGLEDDGIEDLAVEALRVLLPHYPEREYEIDEEFDGLRLKGRLDKFDPETLAIGEVKTGRKWTQGMADSSGQLTTYQALVWKRTGRLSQDIRLFWAPTDRDESGQIYLSGGIRTFRTQRTMVDVLKLLADMRRVQKEIDLMWENYAKTIHD